MDGQAFTYNSFRGKFRDRRQALTKSAAAVGTKRDDGFSGEVISFKERSDRHRDRCPPVRVAQQDDIIYSFHEKRHETLAEYYYRTNRHLLGKIKVAEFDPDKNILRIIQA